MANSCKLFMRKPYERSSWYFPSRSCNFVLIRRGRIRAIGVETSWFWKGLYWGDDNWESQQFLQRESLQVQGRISQDYGQSWIQDIRSGCDKIWPVHLTLVRSTWKKWSALDRATCIYLTAQGEGKVMFCGKSSTGSGQKSRLLQRPQLIVT